MNTYINNESGILAKKTISQQIDEHVYDCDVFFVIQNSQVLLELWK